MLLTAKQIKAKTGGFLKTQNKSTKQTGLHALAGIKFQASEELINSDSLQH